MQALIRPQPAIDISQAFISAPPAMDFVLPNMVAGTVGAVIAPGGAGKSMLALQLAVQVAGGWDMLDIGVLPEGKVSYLPAEDPVVALHHRLHALGAHIPPEIREKVSAGLTIEPLIGANPDLLDMGWLEYVKNAAEGRRLLILDTLRRFHLEDENMSGPMAQVIGRMELIAKDTGCSIVFLHHAGKGSALNGAGDQQQASRGSSVLVDNIRWQAFLCGMSEPEAKKLKLSPLERRFYVRFGVSKANYGQPLQDRWFRRCDGGVLQPVELSAPAKKQRAERGEG